MTPTVALPPKVRAILYYVTVLIGLVLITARATFNGYGVEPPVWYFVVLEVLPVWLATFGLTAATNTVIGDQPMIPPHVGTVGVHRSIHDRPHDDA